MYNYTDKLGDGKFESFPVIIEDWIDGEYHTITCELGDQDLVDGENQDMTILKNIPRPNSQFRPLSNYPLYRVLTRMIHHHSERARVSFFACGIDQMNPGKKTQWMVYGMTKNGDGSWNFNIGKIGAYDAVLYHVCDINAKYQKRTRTLERCGWFMR